MEWSREILKSVYSSHPSLELNIDHTAQHFGISFTTNEKKLLPLISFWLKDFLIEHRPL